MRKATKGRPQKRNITTRGGAEGPPLLVLRTGYMARYDGPDKITGGGAHVEEHGTGGEVFNFKPYRETCYGYAMSRHFAGLDLSKVDGRRLWEEGDELSGVDVVFIAKKGSAGQVVVGWYRDATVYHKQYQLRPSYFPATDEGRTGFFCKACFGTVILLPEKERTFKVPYAPAGHKGFPGKSHVWYPDKHIKERAVQSFVKKLRAYMDKKSKPSGALKERKKRAGRSGKPNHERNEQVELAAVKAVTSYYKKQGYQVKSVEAENRGWDLETTRSGHTLCVEVKGLSDSIIGFELTPNEYRKLKEYGEGYRVCVVCDALTTSPALYELKPQNLGDTWKLVSVLGKPKVVVSWMEKPGAVCREIGTEN